MKLYIKFGEDISIGSKVISIVLLISYRRTDGQTDGRTDKVSHRGAPLLKTLGVCCLEIFFYIGLDWMGKISFHHESVINLFFRSGAPL